VNRRRFVAGCAACATLAAGFARGQGWQAPPRFARPDIASDEGGLWAIMDREETRLRRSPFALRDPQLHAYIQTIACRLAGDHCPDVRVHLVRTPYFNASMAPNGMMQVWTGLMLRVENEAQLAAVLGHEIGHYLERHSVERLRDAKARSGLGTFIGLLGPVGAIGQLGLVAGMYAYGREHERDADRIGALLMHRAGYDVAEASRIWQNLQLEVKARPDGERNSALFATHPAPEERIEALGKLASELPGGESGEAAWGRHVRPFMREWLGEEVKRGQHEESLALLTRMLARTPIQPDYLYARAEVFRLRAKDNDLDAALADYRAAAVLEGAPAEVHRGMGYVYRIRDQGGPARASFQRYLELAPQAPDSMMIKRYMEDLKT
jgi:tetratricopeptide (TPR) repeat protein